MTRLLRTAKSGIDLTEDGLAAYNTTFMPQDKEESLGTIDLSDPAEPSLVDFMAVEIREDAADKKTNFYYIT